MSMKKNTLTGAQAFQVAKWLDENFEAASNKARPAVAAMATEALSFTVTEANILAAEKTTGKSLSRPRGSDKPPSDIKRLVAREVIRLYVQLGLSPNPDLVSIATR